MHSMLYFLIKPYCRRENFDVTIAKICISNNFSLLAILHYTIHHIIFDLKTCDLVIIQLSTYSYSASIAIVIILYYYKYIGGSRDDEGITEERGKEDKSIS